MRNPIAHAMADTASDKVPTLWHAARPTGNHWISSPMVAGVRAHGLQKAENTRKDMGGRNNTLHHTRDTMPNDEKHHSASHNSRTSSASSNETYQTLKEDTGTITHEVSTTEILPGEAIEMYLLTMTSHNSMGDYVRRNASISISSEKRNVRLVSIILAK